MKTISITFLFMLYSIVWITSVRFTTVISKQSVTKIKFDFHTTALSVYGFIAFGKREIPLSESEAHCLI